MAEAMEVDKAASAPGFFVLAFGLVLTTSLRSVGVGCGLSVGVADDRGFLRGLGMVEDRMAELRRHLPHRRHRLGWNKRKLSIS